MTTSKRKRTWTRTKQTNKRPKYNDSSDAEPPASAQDNDGYWTAECILDERREKKRKGRWIVEYLVEWVDIDPSTGLLYPPTWSEKKDVTASLLANWKREKAKKKEVTIGGQAAEGKQTRKHFRVVESSPEPEREVETLSSPGLPIQETTPEHELAAVEPESTPTPPVQIQVRQRGSSFDRTDFERFSQTAASQSTSAQSHHRGADFDSSQLFAAAAPEVISSGIVPDSQSSAGEASFVAATQQTTGTTQPNSSASTDASQDVTEDSGLLEIVQEAASRAHSPAPSIPETVYDTTAESQSQGQQGGSQAPIEISDSSEIVVGSSSLQRDTQEETQVLHHDNDLLASAHTHTEQEEEALAIQTNSQSQSQEHHRSNTPIQPEAEVLGESQREDSPAITQVGQTEASLTEHFALSLEDVTQFPYHSQHPLHSSPTSPQPHLEDSVRQHIEAPAAPDGLSEDAEGASHQGRPGFPFACIQTSESLAPSRTTPVGSEHSATAQAFICTQLPPGGDELLPEVGHVGAVVQSTYEAESAEQDAVRRRDFAIRSEPPQSTGPSTESLEQNAQLVSPGKGLSTQEDTAESIFPTIEVESKGHSSPASRHDSSQDSPDRRLHSKENSSSSIRRPPTHSISTLDSQVPVRPETPGPISSASKMATPDTPKSIKQQLEERAAQAIAARPYTPFRRSMRPTNSPATSTAQTAPKSPPRSSNRLLRGGASPAVEGTRSPSIIPEHSPAPPAPTSLRTIALTQSNQVPTEQRRENVIEAKELTPPPELNVAHATTPPIPAIVTTEATVPDIVSTDDEELVDADDNDAEDTPSILNDDLPLAVEEHIVPLFIEARQSDMYSLHIEKDKRRIFEDFLNDPSGFEPLASIIDAVQYLRAIETHIDLVFAEAAPASGSAVETASQLKLKADWGTENSIKFRFLHTLFNTLRDHDKHVVLVIADDDQVLLGILETFFKAEKLHYNMPTQGREAERAFVEGTTSVTVIPRNASPIIRPADVIICLDGVQDAAQIREKNWARNPELDVVPVLHLVIPRTVGHIERYLSSSLDERERLHTILASLAQMRDEWGKPINENTLRSRDAANRVAEWLLATPKEEKVWPLISIGSVENIVEYLTQRSSSPTVGSPTAGADSAPERSKRPHDDEDLDPAKRMRFTPLPNAVSDSSANENEITHISDSMPNTAVDDATLLERLARLETDYNKERTARKAVEARYREQEVMWEKQQTSHEDLTREYRLLLGRQKSADEKVESLTNNTEALRERLAARTAEMRELTERLEEQRSTHLLSGDEKITEITKLRTELATTEDDMQRHLKSAQTAEKTLEYMKEQYRLARDAATSNQTTIDELGALNVKLARHSSGEPQRLKALHFSRQNQNMESQIKSLRAENGNLKKTLQQRDDDLAKARSNVGRAGVGTRATSATPQPRVRSRAASPMGGRLNHLRSG